MIPWLAIQAVHGGRDVGDGGDVGCRLLRRRAAGKKGGLLLERLSARRSSVVRRLSRGRADIVGFGRFLGNARVNADAIFAAEAAALAERVAGREVLAIQDTSELSYGKRSGQRRGLGPVAYGSSRGVLLHPVLVLDVASGAVLGLAHGAVWTRGKPAAANHQRLPIEAKESNRWLVGGAAAKAALAGATRITLIADRESDIYQAWARLPDERCRLLARAGRDRWLADGTTKLFAASADWPAGGGFDLALPAAPGRAERTARLCLRFGAVAIKRPKNCSDKRAPASLRLHLVEARETAPPAGVEPLHWRLLVSDPVESHAAARQLVELYRQRWHIEQLFRTLKRQGLDIEASQIESAHPLCNLIAMATIAAVRVLQLVNARDASFGERGERPASDAVAAEQRPLLRRVQDTLQGRTAAQRNPHPDGSLPWLAWIVARLGGWTGYASERPPGPITMHNGWIRLQAILDSRPFYENV